MKTKYSFKELRKMGLITKKERELFELAEENGFKVDIDTHSELLERIGKREDKIDVYIRINITKTRDPLKKKK